MTVLQALDGYYDRMAQRGDVVAPGYSVEPIGLVISLDEDGKVIDVAIRRDASGKKPQSQRVPKWFGRQGIGSTPFFLWDNTAYALGVSNKEAGKTSRDHAAFKKLHLEQLADEVDEGLLALRRFLEEWSPDQFAPPLFDEKMIEQNVAFRLESKATGEINGFIHERPAALTLVEHLRNAATKRTEVFCLVTARGFPRFSCIQK